MRPKRYEWPLGLGVEIEILDKGNVIGLIRVLCHRDDPQYDKLANLEEPQLFERALVAVEAKEMANKSRYWQKEIRQLGHDFVSPVYVDFHKPAS